MRNVDAEDKGEHTTSFVVFAGLVFPTQNMSVEHDLEELIEEEPEMQTQIHP